MRKRGNLLCRPEYTVRSKAPFALLAGNIDFQKNPHPLIPLRCFFLNLFRQRHRIHRMDKRGPADQIFYLVFLKMSDHMPPDRSAHSGAVVLFNLLCQFLDIVFPEIRRSGRAGLQDIRKRLPFAYGNQSDILRAAAGSPARSLDPAANRLKIVRNADAGFQFVVHHAPSLL